MAGISEPPDDGSTGRTRMGVGGVVVDVDVRDILWLWPEESFQSSCVAGSVVRPVETQQARTTGTGNPTSTTLLALVDFEQKYGYKPLLRIRSD